MKIRRITIGNHILLLRTAELWNSLPSTTKAINSFAMFKTSSIIIYFSKRGTSVNQSDLLVIDATTAFTILKSLEYKFLKRFLV